VPPTDWNLYNSKSWWMEAKTGGLLLFPSSLTHMVQQVTADEDRISIAFNTFLKGNLGDNKDLTELKLGG
jgi:predicted 2-oxoglutarate/Fe(II)-dependent dioxygenase YbiX